jgi:hypothetical protein
MNILKQLKDNYFGITKEDKINLFKAYIGAVLLSVWGMFDIYTGRVAFS